MGQLDSRQRHLCPGPSQGCFTLCLVKSSSVTEFISLDTARRRSGTFIPGALLLTVRAREFSHGTRPPLSAIPAHGFWARLAITGPEAQGRMAPMSSRALGPTGGAPEKSVDHRYGCCEGS